MFTGSMSSACLWFPRSSARAFLDFWRVSSPHENLHRSLRGETVRYHRLSHKNQVLLCWRPSQPLWLRDTSGCTLKLHPPRSRVIPCPAISPLMSLKYSQLSQDLHDWLGYCAWRKPRKTCCMSDVQRRASQLPWSECSSVFKNNTKIPVELF